MARKNYEPKNMNPEKIKYSKSLLRLNKKGSSLVLTLVVISLIAIISTLALALSLNAYKASVQNKWADEDFYYCEECVNDIYGILIAETNDIFLQNYKQVLSLFTTETPALINEAFREGVKSDLKLKFSYSESNNNPLIEALYKTVEATDNEGNEIGELVVTYDTQRYKEFPEILEEDLKNGRYVFKDVCVEFRNTDRSFKGEDQRKFYASVTTDMVIYIPNLIPSIKTDGEGSLSYVVVSDGELRLNGEAAINGNVYTGNDLIVESTANVSLLSDYINVCNELKNSGKLLISGSSVSANIWCKDFIINGNQPSTVVTGNMFINDDLEINGKNCSVQLSGRYYGYGDNDSSHEKNSAIIVNGEGTRLDMTGIEELLISGHSFFPVNGADISGAESLATIVSQSIYMVAERHIVSKDMEIVVGDKSIAFEQIKCKSNGKNLVTLLSEGYVMLSGGVDLSSAKVMVDGVRLDENKFASDYLASADNMVKVECFDNGVSKYCCLYWNFAPSNSLKSLGADIVSGEYISDLGAGANINVGGNKIVNINAIKVYHGDKQLNIGGQLINAETIFNAPLEGSNTNKEQTYQLEDSLENKYNFAYVSGAELPDNVSLSTFSSDYLDESEPVRAVVVSTKSDNADVYNFEFRLQWNFDSSKLKNKDAGDVFISACIKAGLIDGFLENFMDGGYIKISEDAKISTKADLYEYIAGSNGYLAQNIFDKYEGLSGLLYDSSFYSNQFSNAYKWYMTTLTPEKYNPLETFIPFDNKILSRYSIFERQSYCYNNATKNVENTKYIDFSEIDKLSDNAIEVISAGDYRILIVNGNLAISDSGWSVGGTPINGIESDDGIYGMIFVNGDVKIDKNVDFHGMIISDGIVEISKGNFVFDSDIIEECLEVLKNTNSIRRWETLVSDEFYTRKDVATTGSSSLNAVDCVRFENWTRNRDKVIKAE